MSDWLQRVRPTIQFTSPAGNTFEALWISNTTPQEKKLGIFNYPKINGSVVQDLGINSTRYPMIIYFEGINNDIEAQRFMAAFNESGPWTVIHPVLGEKILQPVSFSPNINPTNSGNITVITTEWIEPISDAVIGSVQELAAKIQEQQNELNLQTAGQFSEITSQETIGEVRAVAQQSGNLLTRFNETVNRLSEINAEINAQVASIQQSINDIIVQPVIDVLSLAGAFQQMVELPSLVINDISSRLSQYIDFARSIFPDPPGIPPNSIDRNNVATTEMVLTAIISTLGTIAVTGDFQTRPEAIQAAIDINNIFIEITNSLDDTQINFSENPADLQYFSQSQTFSDAALLIAFISAYLLKISLDLKIEKKFRLEKDRAPIEIVIKEYGDTGDNDSNLDLFIASNNLKANEILLLPSGREVIVYV